MSLPRSPPRRHRSLTAVQEAADGLEAAYRTLCACREARLPGSACDADDFEGYDPEAVRETLERHAELGDGFTECIRDIVRRLSACLSAEHGCEQGSCPDSTSLLDDSRVLEELGESCPRR